MHTTIRYLVIGGTVVSPADGQTHYVNAQELRRLYRLPYTLCLHMEEDNPWAEPSRVKRHFPELIVLRPRSDGNYDLESPALDPNQGNPP